MYHLYCLDLPSPAPPGPAPPCPGGREGRDLLAAHPRLTCCVGFVGGLQLWLPREQPNIVILSTGTGSLLWDLSELRLDTGQLRLLRRNPASSYAGRAALLLQWAWHCLVAFLCAAISFLSASCVAADAACIMGIAPAPSAPLQYFVDELSGSLVGCAECAVAFGISLRFTHRQARCGAWVRVGGDIPLAELSMQLVGAGGAAGTMRMDTLTHTDTRTDTHTDSGGGGGELGVAIHTCACTDTTAYVQYPGGRVLANHGSGDIEDFVVNPVSGAVEGVVVVTDRAEVLPLGEGGARFLEALGRVACSLGLPPSAPLAVCSRSADDGVWVVRAAADSAPPSFYLVNRPYEQNTPIFLLSARPNLAQCVLCPREAVRVPARDGEMLPCLLCLPQPQPGTGAGAGAGPGRGPGPLAIVLHGGPSAREYPGFDPLTQLLAARGVAVLSVNYRGSTGFGTRYLRLGSGALQGMHDDVEDARQWAVDRGVADPGRIAIIGGSWGGYLALGGATGISTSTGSTGTGAASEAGAGPGHRYAAVVAVVPLVSVGAANTSQSFRGDPLVARYWRQVYGPAVSDSRLAAERLSPACRLARLAGTRLLLVHGEDDPRVPRAHGDVVAAAAARLALPGGYLTYAEEGHSIRRGPNVLHMNHTIEKFLCRAFELPPPPALDAASVKNNTATLHWSKDFDD
jgi:acetyl esterase/lipase